jgi:hypothetical protein
MPSRAKHSNLIKAYGLFWRLDETEWVHEGASSRNLRLLGRHGGHVSDFWRQWGLYVLYGNYGPYYLGISSEVGKRVHDHFKGQRHRNKWDRFSWFGFNEVVDATDRNGLSMINVREKPARRKSSEVKFANALADIEAVLFRAMSPVGNDATPAFGDPRVQEWKQVKLRDVDRLLKQIKP